MRLISLCAALLVVAGLYYWFGVRPGAGEPRASTPAVADSAGGSEAPAPVEVFVLASEAREMQGTLTLRGRTVANRRVEVAAETTGRVISPIIRRGSTVTIGQVLCQLDAGTRPAELAEAEAALAEAEALASAAEQLAVKGYTAETELKQRRAQLRAAQASLDGIKADIEKLKTHAPFDGVLETDTAVLGTLLTPGTICAEVVDLDPMTAEAFVSATDVGKLAVGQSAEVRLVDGTEAAAMVSYVSRTGDEATRTFAVEVTMPNPDHAIRAGMTAEITIELPPVRAHLLPRGALTLDDAGQLGVRLAVDGHARFEPVTILRGNKEGVWADGLPDRARVIVRGQEFVRDGGRIKALPASAGISP